MKSLAKCQNAVDFGPFWSRDLDPDDLEILTPRTDLEYYKSAKSHEHRTSGFREKRGQSSTFDLEYLGNYVKVKVKVIWKM